jgi:hypothetical protein
VTQCRGGLAPTELDRAVLSQAASGIILPLTVPWVAMRGFHAWPVVMTAWSWRRIAAAMTVWAATAACRPTTHNVGVTLLPGRWARAPHDDSAPSVVSMSFRLACSQSGQNGTAVLSNVGARWASTAEASSSTR